MMLSFHRCLHPQQNPAGFEDSSGSCLETFQQVMMDVHLIQWVKILGFKNGVRWVPTNPLTVHCYWGLCVWDIEEMKDKGNE